MLRQVVLAGQPEPPLPATACVPFEGRLQFGNVEQILANRGLDQPAELGAAAACGCDLEQEARDRAETQAAASCDRRAPDKRP